MTRFHPFWALIEMTMGIVAARHVMLDTEEDKKKKPTLPGENRRVLQVLLTLQRDAANHGTPWKFGVPS